MSFAEELARLLPDDLPHRENVVSKAARHLELVAEANRQFNLTRITGERDAAIKHVLDSVIPWPLFAGAGRVLDAGTGAGFPGVPLALVYPDKQFVLAESTGKKARFVRAAVDQLGLKNVAVAGERAEEVLRSGNPDVITARAVAPVGRTLDLFWFALRQGTEMLLYKGPDPESEIAEAGQLLRSRRISADVVKRYELPDGAGSRTVIRLRAVTR